MHDTTSASIHVAGVGRRAGGGGAGKAAAEVGGGVSVVELHMLPGTQPVTVRQAGDWFRRLCKKLRGNCGRLMLDKSPSPK